MISVAEAEQIILKETRNYRTETVRLHDSVGRVVAEDIYSDRDLPPYDRVTMDGIAIHFDGFEKDIRQFIIKGTQAAGSAPIDIDKIEQCVEIMTGASLPSSCDTVIRYEDLTIADGCATINIEAIRRGQNIHYKSDDKKAGQLLANANQIITPAFINTAASVGKNQLVVKKTPKVVVISTGDELVDVDSTPTPFQIRRSNSHTIATALQQQHVQVELLHIPDSEDNIKKTLKKCLNNFDVLILSGGVSMGKYDYLPKALNELEVEQKFHKIKQRPGKPFWFGISLEKKPVFAFPGNAVSAFMCFYRYFMPWLKTSMELKPLPTYAVLDRDYEFKKDLQYFLQVQLNSSETGQLIATPSEGNGSGDFVNLLYTDAFMELPEKQTNFKKGEAYRVWPYKTILQ